ncbi:MAG: 4-hydroxythreonine-4-phosphate dehydrogenase PdxA [Armatimonadetes bacterium]|nr:4-hydroxythreonine-4-phosphate dehydrogenase PdxA [Armatimonadota bacterium]
MRKPVVGITMGDAAGIGPEIIMKSLNAGRVYDYCRPLVIGNPGVMRRACEITKVDWSINEIDDVSEARFELGTADVLRFGNLDAKMVKMGEEDAAVGRAAVICTQQAGRLALEGKIDAMSSAPLNKAAMRAAGFHYEGATQILTELCGSKNSAMMLILGKLKLIFYSNPNNS